MRHCPLCGARYPDEGRFCPQDGRALLSAPEPAERREAELAQAGPRPIASLRPGTIVGGRFRLEEEIGQGATAVIYRARHVVFGRSCAVKLLRREYIADEKSLRRFLREAVIAARVDHPHIIRMHDFGRTPDGHAYLVMEHLSGRTLYDVLCAGRGLPLLRTLRIALQIASALAHAHARGVIHRDVKPENVLLTEYHGQTDWVKILDFGLAKVLDLPPLSVAGEVLGTPAYLSPEALTGSHQIGPAADVYAIGILLHDCLAGTPPFTGDLLKMLQQHQSMVPAPLSVRRPDLQIPPALDRLAARLLDKTPAKRPSAEQVADELQRILGDCKPERGQVDRLGPILDALAALLYPRGPSGQRLPAEVGALRRRLDRALQEVADLGAQLQVLEQEAREVQHRMQVEIETLRGRILNLEERRGELQLAQRAIGDIDEQVLALEQELDAVEETAAYGWHKRELQELSGKLVEARGELSRAMGEIIDFFLRVEEERGDDRSAPFRRHLLLLRAAG